MNQVQIGQVVVGRWCVGGLLQVPLGPELMLQICSFSVLESCMKHCLYLFLCIAETVLWKEKSRIRAVQRDNLRGLLGISMIDRVPNARIRQFCRVTKEVDEKIAEGVERMENEPY